MAEVVFSHKAAELGLSAQFVVDSAGIAGDVGFDMDRRARKALERRGYSPMSHRARQFEPDWLHERDLVLAMDRGHLRWLERMAANEPAPVRLELLLAFAKKREEKGASLEIADPYFKAERDFDSCLGLIEDACTGLVSELASGLAL